MIVNPEQNRKREEEEPPDIGVDERIRLSIMGLVGMMVLTAASAVSAVWRGDDYGGRICCALALLTGVACACTHLSIKNYRETGR